MISDNRTHTKVVLNNPTNGPSLREWRSANMKMKGRPTYWTFDGYEIAIAEK